jgi:hypothetical protein
MRNGRPEPHEEDLVIFEDPLSPLSAEGGMISFVKISPPCRRNTGLRRELEAFRGIRTYLR